MDDEFAREELILKALIPVIVRSTKDQVKELVDANKDLIIAETKKMINERSKVIKEEILRKLNVPELIGEIRKENARMKEELFRIQGEVFKTAKEVSDQLFNDATFTRKLERHFDSKVRSSINETMSEAGLTKFLRAKIDDEVKDHLLETVKRVVETVFNKVRKSAEYDLKLAKEICYSVDAEVKHFSMRAGISAETEKIIMDRLDQKFDIAAKAIMQDLKTRRSRFLTKG